MAWLQASHHRPDHHLASQFQITGTPTWTDVPGTATTTSSAGPITVYEARTRLVEDASG